MAAVDVNGSQRHTFSEAAGYCKAGYYLGASSETLAGPLHVSLHRKAMAAC